MVYAACYALPHLVCLHTGCTFCAFTSFVCILRCVRSHTHTTRALHWLRFIAPRYTAFCVRGCINAVRIGCSIHTVRSAVGCYRATFHRWVVVVLVLPTTPQFCLPWFPCLPHYHVLTFGSLHGSGYYSTYLLIFVLPYRLLRSAVYVWIGCLRSLVTYRCRLHAFSRCAHGSGLVVCGLTHIVPLPALCSSCRVCRARSFVLVVAVRLHVTHFTFPFTFGSAFAHAVLPRILPRLHVAVRAYRLRLRSCRTRHLVPVTRLRTFGYRIRRFCLWLVYLRTPHTAGYALLRSRSHLYRLRFTHARLPTRWVRTLLVALGSRLDSRYGCTFTVRFYGCPAYLRFAIWLPRRTRFTYLPRFHTVPYLPRYLPHTRFTVPLPVYGSYLSRLRFCCSLCPHHILPRLRFTLPGLLPWLRIMLRLRLFHSADYAVTLPHTQFTRSVLPGSFCYRLRIPLRLPFTFPVVGYTYCHTRVYVPLPAPAVMVTFPVVRLRSYV